MSLPFARSTRALHMDRPYSALVVLALAILLLGLWAAWFFSPSIPLYETGQIVSTTRRGTLVANFSAQAAPQLQAGQLAVLRPEGNVANQFNGVPAMVMAIDYTVTDGQIQVNLAPLLDQESNRIIVKDFQGQVAVEVENISPAQMVWRASGQGVDTAAVLIN